jgi:hypothetical protein
MALRAPPRCMKILFCEGAIFQIDQFGQLMDIIVFTEQTVIVVKPPLFQLPGSRFRVSSFEFRISICGSDYIFIYIKRYLDFDRSNTPADRIDGASPVLYAPARV